MGFKLADLFIQFTAQGTTEVLGTIDELWHRLEIAKQVAEEAGRVMSDAFHNADSALSRFVTSGGMGQLKIALGGAIDNFKAMESSVNEVGGAADILGGRYKSNFDQVSKLAKDLFSKDLASGTEAATRQLFDQVTALKGMSDAESGALWKRIQHTTAIDAFNAKLDKSREAWEGYGRVAGFVLAGVTGTLGGFVTAGLQGTAVGEMLTYRFSELSRTIAGVFGPEIQQLIDFVSSLTQWLNSLSDAQKDNLVLWLEIGAASLAFLAIVPRIITAIQGMIAIYRALAVSEIIAQAFAGPAGWAILATGAAIAATVGAAYGLGAFGGDAGSDKEKSSGRRSPLALTTHFQATEAAWTQMQEKLIGVGKSPAEKHLDIAEQQLEEQKRTNTILGGKKDAWS